MNALGPGAKIYTETVKLLLDRSADLHAFGDLALYWAVDLRDTETVKLLLKHGATITAEKKWKSRNSCLIEIKLKF